MKLVGLTILITSVIVVLILWYGSHKAEKLPDNCPAGFLTVAPPSANQKVVICIGNSITHGRVSANYMDMLASCSGEGYQFVNAGINGDLAWNVLQRLDEIVACKPDYITLLIGTNDAKATVVEKDARISMKKKDLPQLPDTDWYRENLLEICRQLQERTSARIALLSLPPVGEDRDHLVYRRIEEYSAFIKQTAEEFGFDYLPLHEAMNDYLIKNDHSPKLSYDMGFRPVMYKAIFRHFIFGQSFNTIAEANGFLLLTDFLHLNETGAEMVADIIEDFIEKEENIL